MSEATRKTGEIQRIMHRLHQGVCLGAELPSADDKMCRFVGLSLFDLRVARDRGELRRAGIHKPDRDQSYICIWIFDLDKNLVDRQQADEKVWPGPRDLHTVLRAVATDAVQLADILGQNAIKLSRIREHYKSRYPI